MTNMQKVNSLYLDMLSPLLKWKILDLKNLLLKSSYSYGIKSFSKVILKLEKNLLIKSVRDPWNNRKYIYLTELGINCIDGDHQYPSISVDTIYHDAKVSEVVQELICKDCFSTSMLEHEFKSHHSGQLPDAILTGTNQSVPFKMAFELELSRKCKSRVIAKVRRYLANEYYDYIFYLFCSKSLMCSYKKIIFEEFGEELFSRVMLFTNQTITSKKFDLSLTKGWFYGEEILLDKLFY